MSTGAEDVVDHVAGGAGGPLWQSVGLAVRPAGDGILHFMTFGIS